MLRTCWPRSVAIHSDFVLQGRHEWRRSTVFDMPVEFPTFITAIFLAASGPIADLFGNGRLLQTDGDIR